jgi:hypothetical protein
MSSDGQRDLNLHLISLLTRLEHLSLGVIDSSLTYDLLSNLRSLRSLELSWPEVSGADAQLAQQQQEEVRQQGFHLAGALTVLQQLRHLRLRNIAIPSGLTVGQLSALTYLSVYSTDASAVWFQRWHQTMKLESLRHVSLSAHAALQFLQLAPDLPGVTDGSLELELELRQGRNRELRLLQQAPSVVQQCRALELRKDAGGQEHEHAVEELRSALATLSDAWALQSSLHAHKPRSLEWALERRVEMSGFYCPRPVVEQVSHRLRWLVME